MRSRMPLVAAALAALAIPSTVEAHGGQPFVFTQVVAGAIDDIPFVGCSGEVEGFVSIVFRETFHITEFADGHVNVSGNNRGTFDYVPFDGLPSSGHYKNGFHFSATPNGVVDHDVFTGAGRDVEGTTDNFNVRNHVTYANGEVRVEFSAGCD